MSSFLIVILIISLSICNLLSFNEMRWSKNPGNYHSTQSTGSEKQRLENSVNKYLIKTEESFKRYLRSLKNYDNLNDEKIHDLSNLLRIRIDDFRSNTDRIDIVFLVDASSSIGHENFQSELNFVRKVLSDLTVEESSTRIAIITFAGKGMITRNIDQISSSKFHGNKCTLLNEEFKNISYTGGSTYTRGALLQALMILQNSRDDAKKVIFLITDGFSNAGDPKPTAEQLKNLGTTILTFGIRTGNVAELYDISSKPGHTHSYFLDSFKEFEALARQALHRDLRVGKYIRLDSKKPCLHLCTSLNNIDDNDEEKNKTEENCCDALAECTCGTTSGHLACLCPPGYYGSGLRGSCHPCPNGTYGQAETPGDSSENCLPCPNINHVTLKLPATSSDDCVCAFGYITNGPKCEAITCPKLKVPENGYLVKANACNNVVNAACGLRCKIGFRLVGDSIQLCRINGTWSGTETQCLLKTCPILRAPAHGQIECQHDDNNYDIEITNNESLAFPIDTQCQFKCDTGYQLLGSKYRNCLPVSRWDGLKVSCKQIKCEPLRPIENGLITPGVCTGTKKLIFGTNCTITCLNGFTLEGPARKKCGGSSGLWSNRKSISRCVDKTPPKIICPKNSTWRTIPGKKYSLPTWSIPSATDNSGSELNVWSKPHLLLPWKSKIGLHIITYIAQDPSGNRARCRFTITTLDEEPPTVENCMDPPVYLSTNSRGAENVTWDEPRFRDNSGKKVTVIKNYQQGSFFSIGQTQIVYNATDSSYNSIGCIMNITVVNTCERYPTFSNGQTNCNKIDKESYRCLITCDKGHIWTQLEESENTIDSNEEIILTCNSQAAWNYSFISSCSITEIPDSLDFGGSIYAETNNSICDNSIILDKLKSHINEKFESKFFNICSNEKDINCHSLKSNLNCLEKLSSNTMKIRRLRSINDKKLIKLKHKNDKIEIKFHFITKIVSENRNNPERGIQKLRNELNSMIESGKLNLLNEKTNYEIANIALNLQVIFHPEIKDVCEPGKVMRKNKCVKCPAGTFHNSTRDICQACYLSEYQDTVGSTSCKKCPDKMSTKRIHSTIKNECTKLCYPGNFSKKRYHKNQRVAMEPCSPCEIGFYQPHYGRFQCFPCPNNMTTNLNGSTSLQHCIPIESPNFCHPESCLNNGKCVSEDSGFSCECLDNFIGSRCEKLGNPCDSSPCINEGTCIFNPNQFPLKSYVCTCKINYSGRNCEIYIDECTSNPCKNNATCTSTDSDFFCNCTDNFAGEYCEIPLNLCDAGTCEEGSTCVVRNGKWNCHCKPGHLGRHCELVPCDWLPCHPNAICINIDDKNTTINSYKCECSPGYQGDDCTIRINHCKTSPCQNNGICINNLTNYTCDCPSNFDGTNCEIKLTSDFLLNFFQPGVTDYVMIPGPKFNLTEFTICCWLQSIDTFNYGTIFSYATEIEDNQVTLTDYNGLVLYIDGKSVVTDISLNDGKWHFLCVTWESLNGTWWIYVDGVLRDSGKNLASGAVIPGNGSVVIGQEQDRFRGRFSASESFIGNITLLDVFQTALNEEIIKNLTDNCLDYAGTLISWSIMKKYIKGSVKILESPFCRGCKIPDNPSNGFVNITDDKSELIYSCDSGYVIQLENNQQTILRRKCLKQGHWEGQHEPNCTKIYCGFPEHFSRGEIKGNSFYFDDEILYSCEEGYEIHGNFSRLCKADGNWSGVAPVCVGVTCENIEAPEHGIVEMINEEQDKEETTIIQQVGQQVEFKCNPGFKLIGNKILTCNSTGKWNFDNPICEAIGCLQPKIPIHSSINISLDLTEKPLEIYQFNDVVEIFCDVGFKFRVDESQIEYEYLKCSNNGSWIGSIPDCIPLRCPVPEIEHGKVKNLPENAVPGERLEVDCQVGYELSNKNTEIYCGETEKWSQEINFKCQKKQCSSVMNHSIAGLFFGKNNKTGNIKYLNTTNQSDKLKNFRLAIEGDRFGDKLILYCSNELNNFKFNLTNEEFHQIIWLCDKKGNWKLQDLNFDDDELRKMLLSNNLCDDGTCPPPVVLSNAILVGPDGGDSANITWKINSTVRYECKNGFVLEGVGTSTCMSNGLWSGFALCRAESCSSPLRLQNAEVISDDDYEFGKIIQYKCLPGYRMLGQGMSRCLATGKWSKIQGKCLRISCEKPNISSHATINGKSFLYQEELTVICEKNNLQINITCLADGKWSNLPVC